METIFSQIQKSLNLPLGIQNQNAQNANISGINQDELGSILERMLKLPYLNNADTKQYDFSSQNKDGLSVLGQGNELLNKILDGVNSQINKAKDDYDGLTPIEKAQKWTSKHASGWVPSEYYGISEYLADDGEMPDKYKKNNDHYKLGDIADERTQEIISTKVQKARKDCPVGPYINTPLEDVDVIVPKENSELVQKVKRSDEIAEFIDKNKEELQAGETVNGAVEFKKPSKSDGGNAEYLHEFNDKLSRFTAIHYADIVDAKMHDDGTISMKVVDYYDFTKLKEEDGFDKLNNRAYKQQELGKLKPYAIYFELTY